MKSIHLRRSSKNFSPLEDFKLLNILLAAYGIVINNINKTLIFLRVRFDINLYSLKYVNGNWCTKNRALH